MKAQGLVWLGIRTTKFEETAGFFRDSLGLRAEQEEPDFAVFSLLNGDTVELFGPGDQDHAHFTTGPVVGFSVDDVEKARSELEAAGTVFIGPVHGSRQEGRYSHFLGPDGSVYEVKSRPGSD